MQHGTKSRHNPSIQALNLSRFPGDTKQQAYMRVHYTDQKRVLYTDQKRVSLFKNSFPSLLIHSKLFLWLSSYSHSLTPCFTVQHQA